MSLMFFHIFLFTPSLLSSFPLPNYLSLSPPYLSATNLANYDLFQTEITKNLTTVEWREDLKKVITFTEDKIIYIYIHYMKKSPCGTVITQ